MDNDNTEPFIQPTPRKPMNLMMKIGLFSAIGLILLSQSIIMVFLPMNPSQAELLINVGSSANYLAIVAVIALVAGVLVRRFGR